jgi:Tol biopolymer transport system component
MTALRVLLAVALLSLVAPALAEAACVAPAGPVASLTGRVVYQQGAGIFLFDFLGATSCTQPVAIPLVTDTGVMLLTPTNPVFSPDGQSVLFTAIQNNTHDLFYWVVGASTVTDLTVGIPMSRNEDGKFSPDGTSIVWKETFGISVASLRIVDAGPTIGPAQPLVTGTDGASSEASAPTYSPDAMHIYYYTGSNCGPPETLQVVASTGGTHGPLFSSQSTALYYYYPRVDLVTGKLFYVSGAAAPCKQSGGPDQIFYFPNANNVDPSSTATAWNPGDGSDNSDPTSVDGDFFLFSRDHNANGDADYDLYLGQLSSIASPPYWSLTQLQLGTGIVGADYTPTRPVDNTQFLMGAPNYRANSGGCAPRC